MRTLFVLAFVSLFLSSCNNDKESCVTQPDVKDIHVDIQIQQLQDSFVDVRSKEKLVALLSRYPVVRDGIFRRAEYPSDSSFVNALYSKLTNPHLDTLVSETKRVFGDLSALQSEFDEAFTNVKYYIVEDNHRLHKSMDELDWESIITS